jgi:hypothetical protein
MVDYSANKGRRKGKEGRKRKREKKKHIPSVLD